MNKESGGSVGRDDVITPADRRNVRLWAAMLVVLFATSGGAAAWTMYSNSGDARIRHQDRMNPAIGEGGSTPPSAALPAGAVPLRTHAGIYVDRVVDLSVREAAWTVDFYLWFRWTGPAADPGETFTIVDGSIESKEKADTFTSGDEHYALYRVVARMTKFFDVSRFPRDDHVLTINVESPPSERHELLFVADTASSGVSSRVQTAGYAIRQQTVLEKPHAYRSTLGDPRLAGGTERVQSHLRMGIWIHRQDWGFYIKMFVALFAAVGVAMLAFCIKPTNVDPRFGLGLGAMGAAIVNTYVTSSLVPDTGVMTLADTVNHFGIVTIALSLLQSAISLYIYEKAGKVALSQWFDRVSLVVFVTGYAAINFAVPWAATL